MRAVSTRYKRMYLRDNYEYYPFIWYSNSHCYELTYISNNTE